MLTLIKKSYVFKISVLLLFFVTFFCVNLYAIVEPTFELYVNDYAELLDDETKLYIINVNKELYSKMGSQVVVVTIPSLENSSPEEYSTELFRRFDIGEKDKNNGVLMLLALEERKFRVEVGYGLEGALPDGKIGRIQDEYIIPYFNQNNWNEGIKNGFNAIINVITEEYNVEVSANKVITSEYVSSDLDNFGIYILISLVISAIVGSILGIKKKRKKVKGSVILIVACIYFVIIISVFSIIINNGIENVNGEIFANGKGSSIVLFTIFNFISFIMFFLRTYVNRIGGFYGGSGRHHYGGFSSGRRFFW